jgi:hypothetical protein
MKLTQFGSVAGSKDMPRRSYRTPKRRVVPYHAPTYPSIPPEFRSIYENAELVERLHAPLPSLSLADLNKTLRTRTALTIVSVILAAAAVGLIAGIAAYEVTHTVGPVRGLNSTSNARVASSAESGIFIGAGGISWLVIAGVVAAVGSLALGYVAGHLKSLPHRRMLTEYRVAMNKWRVELDAALASKLRFVELEQGKLRALDESFRTGYIAGRKWLAEAAADIWSERDKVREFVLRTKPRPGISSAEIVKEAAAEKRELMIANRLLRMQIATYEEYFPELIDYRELILDEAVDFTRGEGIEDIDPVRLYVSSEEYEALSVTERNQHALDRYKARRKSDWEIGRQYERQVGWLYESEGWRVRYEGALKRLADFGRDLIAERDGRCEVIQCKNWSALKVIREKHVFQLFGTTTLFRISDDRAREAVRAVLYTTTQLSDEAQAVAKDLGVDVRNLALQDYPMIKCNVTASGERIYHLPFDQMYDRVVIGNMPGECYASSVEEAEDLGFRRAYRWTPASSN